MKNPTKVSAVYLGKQLFKMYAKECIKKGKTQEQIINGWTIEKLNDMSKEFCSKYNFQIID